MEIISKEEAIKRGLNYYFTGKPCKNGHIARRLLSSPHCAECKLEKRKQYYVKNIDAQRAKGRNYHHRNREVSLARMSKWQKENKESIYARNRAWRNDNKNKISAANKIWRENNRAYIRFHNVCRIAHIKLATPQWADMKKIKAIYAMALIKTETTGVQYHVDHIVPLRGKLVCGLHVENNLRVIPAKDNLIKGNRI